MRLALALSVLALSVLALSSLDALAATPEGKKLSEIIATIEQGNDLQYIHEIDWSRRGYYKIEYVRTDGARVKIRIDPKTGSPVR